LVGLHFTPNWLNVQLQRQPGVSVNLVTSRCTFETKTKALGYCNEVSQTDVGKVASSESSEEEFRFQAGECYSWSLVPSSGARFGHTSSLG